jgi:hypothetical protein
MTIFSDAHLFADTVQFPPMSNWRARFREALEKDGRSERRLSTDAGFGHAFVSGMLDRDDPREPSVANLQRLCKELKVSFAWITTGLEVTPEVEELMAIMTKLPDGDRETLLRLSRSMQRAADTPEDAREARKPKSKASARARH